MSELPREICVDMLANVHGHYREGDVVAPLIRLAIEGGADVLGPMPNTKDGLITARAVDEYCSAAQELAGPEVQILPILMLNENTSCHELEMAQLTGVLDCKVYPLNRTTRSENGVRDYPDLLDRVNCCGKVGMKVHFHPEHPWMLFDNEDAEFAFLSIADMFLRLTEATIVWEHGTDARCIPFWKEMAKTGRFSVTLAAHHLVTNSSASFGDVRAVCKPPIKTMRDQSDLIKLVEEGHEWVMAGLDDAPHDIEAKHVDCDNCACGAYTAPFGLQLYAHALPKLMQTPEGIKKFVDFTSRNARKLHGLKPSCRQVKLVKMAYKIPKLYQPGTWKVQPFWANREIDWTLEM